MTRDEFCRTYWDYYLVLESDVLSIERYVSFYLGDNSLYITGAVSDMGNSLCFSNEFVKQYQAICSEVDVILKTICQETGSQSSASNMKDYTDIILNLQEWSSITQQKIEIHRQQSILQPFLNWSPSPNYNAPDWFPLYNKVKHNRSMHYRDANLKNTLNALAGLYLLEIYLVKHIADRDNQIAKANGTWSEDDDIPDVPDDVSKLFQVPSFQTKHTVIGRGLYVQTKESVDAMFDKIFSE